GADAAVFRSPLERHGNAGVDGKRNSIHRSREGKGEDQLDLLRSAGQARRQKIIGGLLTAPATWLAGPLILTPAAGDRCYAQRYGPSRPLRRAALPGYSAFRGLDFR